MLLTFTEKPVSVSINVTIVISGPAALCMLIEFFLKLSLIFAAFFSDVINSDASAINSCKFSLLFLL